MDWWEESARKEKDNNGYGIAQKVKDVENKNQKTMKKKELKIKEKQKDVCTRVASRKRRREKNVTINIKIQKFSITVKWFLFDSMHSPIKIPFKCDYRFNETNALYNFNLAASTAA